MLFYDIDGNRIYIAECATCHNQIALTNEQYNDFPSLSEIDRKNKCCKRPYYKWLDTVLEIQQFKRCLH